MEGNISMPSIMPLSRYVFKKHRPLQNPIKNAPQVCCPNKQARLRGLLIVILATVSALG